MKTNFKYILKDSHNTYISIHNTENEVFEKLHEFSEKFNDTFSTFGARYDLNTGEDLPTFEDSAVFTIPKEMRRRYNDDNYITFYFFKFDLDTNKRIDLYN